MTTVGESLKHRFDETFRILQVAIQALDDQQWTQGGPPYDGPARATLHVLQAAEFYTHGRREVFRWQGRGVWEMSGEELPSRSQMLRYLDEVQEMTGDWIARLDREALANGGDAAGEAVGSVAYALCHLQHHTGEVCAWMKQFGHSQETWV